MFSNFLSNTFLRIISFFLLAFAINFIFELLMPYEWIYLDVHTVLSILIASIFIESSRYESKFYAFGIYWDRGEFRNIGIGLLLALFFFATYIALSQLAGARVVLSENFALSSFLISSYAIFLSASFEELLFRGIILQSLIEKFGKTIPVILISLIFSLAHLFNPNISYLAVLNVFLVGIVFSLMYLKTKTLWLPISFHFFWNWLQGRVFGINVSGLGNSKSIFGGDFSQLNPALFGGEFGAEGGMICTIFLIIIIPIILIYSRENQHLSSLLKKRSRAERVLNNIID